MEKLKLNIQLFGGSLSISAYETDVSVENNTSYIQVDITASTSSGTYNETGNAYVQGTATGQNNTYSIAKTYFKIGKGSSKVVYSNKLGPFNHNTDGSLNPVTISANAYIVSNTQPSASINVTMQTIPRASQITVADANIGSSTNITINKNSGSFTTTIWYKAEGQNNWTKIVDKTSNQVYGWTVPTSFYSLIPNKKTMSCQFYADTYNGSTFIGSSSTITATFTATGNPTISNCGLEAIDTTTINLVGADRMIRYISTIQATVTASAINSASISSIKVNDITATNGVATFTNADTNTYQVVVTDSRGYTATNTYTIVWTDYVMLTLNATISRNQPTDNKVKINYGGNYYNGLFITTDNTYVSNYLSVQYRYKERNGSFGSWIDLAPTITDNTYAESNFLVSNINYQKQYDFEIKANDGVSTKTISLSVSKGEPVYWWNEDSFNINGDLLLKGDLQGLKIPYAYYFENSRETLYNVVAWTDTRVPFNGQAFSTSHSDLFEKNGDYIKCKFTGKILIIRQIAIDQQGELDIADEFSWFTATGTKQNYSITIKNVNTGDNVDFIISGGMSGTVVIYSARMILLRLS